MMKPWSACSIASTPRRKKFILFFALACVLAVTAVSFAVRGFEPSYRGRTISEWAEILRPHRDSAEAHAAIKAIGQPGLEYLWRECNFTNSIAREQLGQWLKQLNLPGVQFTRPETRRSSASYAISVLGTNAAPLIPRLIPLLQDEGNVHRTGCILAAIGKDGCAAIVQHLASGNPNSRQPLFHALSIADEDVVVAVLRENDTPAIRALAVDFFSVIRPRTEAEARYLAEYLRDPNPRLREQARRTLQDLHGILTKLTSYDNNDTSPAPVDTYIVAQRKLLQLIPTLLATNAPPSLEVGR